ncbi:MAG: DsrE family protein [Nitrospira sp.]|nr:DsrE family protein [bacterium]MBL7049484.1 DsrE family protein [Nitrospira sp.]
MKLGILVNTDRHLDEIEGISMAALKKGHEVAVFFMDEGVRLLADKKISGLAEVDNINMSYCDYSTMRIGLCKEGISDNISCGSQFDNSSMNHDSDRVVVL